MSADEKRELADIKKHWSHLIDKHNEGRLPPIGIALWASIHVDRLIALAEKNQ